MIVFKCTFWSKVDWKWRQRITPDSKLEFGDSQVVNGHKRIQKLDGLLQNSYDEKIFIMGDH